MPAPAGPPPGFSLPDHSRPLDPEAVCAEMRPDAMLRGMYMQGVLELCEKRGKPLAGAGRFLAFKEYPVPVHVRLLAEAGKALYPNEPLRRAFNLLGQDAYAVLEDSMIGRVIFGVLQRDIVRITKLVHKAYEISGHGVSATLLDMGDSHSHVRIDGAFGLVDCYHVGAFEGVCRACRRSCTIWTKPTPTGGELFTIWGPPTRGP